MNVANTIEKQVLDLYKTTAYQKLNAYYGQSSLFNVLGIERRKTAIALFCNGC
ncbi:MAG: hypothetical protein UH687_00075 [Bacteroidaceae bacterium]|nr:hypothetical protein [Bacteroidaceae bacterium]